MRGCAVSSSRGLDDLVFLAHGFLSQVACVEIASAGRPVHAWWKHCTLIHACRGAMSPEFRTFALVQYPTHGDCPRPGRFVQLACKLGVVFSFKTLRLGPLGVEDESH